MKLILCRKCHDVFKLDYETRKCKCGECFGKYLNDGLVAEVNKPSIVLGFNNNSLADALNFSNYGKLTSKYMGDRFEAFIISQKSDTIRTVKG